MSLRSLIAEVRFFRDAGKALDVYPVARPDEKLVAMYGFGKPRLKKVGHLWVCYLPGNRRHEGCGATPILAYHLWVRSQMLEAGRPNEERFRLRRDLCPELIEKLRRAGL